jgi:hypothetical protein
MSDPWILTVRNVNINSRYPCDVTLEITPCEWTLIKAGIIRREELEEAYREAIERGSCRHCRVLGGHVNE